MKKIRATKNGNVRCPRNGKTTDFSKVCINCPDLASKVPGMGCFWIYCLRGGSQDDFKKSVKGE